MKNSLINESDKTVYSHLQKKHKETNKSSNRLKNSLFENSKGHRLFIYQM